MQKAVYKTWNMNNTQITASADIAFNQCHKEPSDLKSWKITNWREICELSDSFQVKGQWQLANKGAQDKDIKNNKKYIIYFINLV